MAKKTTTSASPAAAPKRTPAKASAGKAAVSEKAAAARPVAKKASAKKAVSKGQHRVGTVEVGVEMPKFTITDHDIATLAYSYWERRGYQGGSQQEDWDRAERELRSLLG